MINPHWSAEGAQAFSQNHDNSSGLFFQNIERRFAPFGVQHALISGLPLPGRDMSKLVLYQSWGQDDFIVTHFSQIRGNDPLLRRVAVLADPKIWNVTGSDGEWLMTSPLFSLLQRYAGTPQSCNNVVGIHVPLEQMQLIILLAGASLSISERDLDHLARTVTYEIAEAHSNSPLLPTRAGELSVREKMVLSLTAEGLTAGDIAGKLEISQRTVHAHLQNASEKMQAANKTQTVVEALRYGQISLS